MLIHVEVQGEPEDGFAERMYTYQYRLRDRYGIIEDADATQLEQWADHVLEAHSLDALAGEPLIKAQALRY